MKGQRTWLNAPLVRRAALATLLPGASHASLLSGDALDSMAMGVAWMVIFVVPIALIVLFWKLHVLPEKIAEARHHPQKDAIHVLCILSLFVGGLLWPLAWLWAYTRPVTNVLAFGTDKHLDYFHEMDERWRAGHLDADSVRELRAELDEMARKARLPGPLDQLRRDLHRAAPGAAPAAVVSHDSTAPVDGAGTQTATVTGERGA